MKLQIVKIGNSQGIRIPRLLLEQTGLEGEVEVLVRNRTLVIQHVHRVRQGWDEAFAGMVAHQDDRLSEGEDWAGNEFDEEEWEWS